jgi:hypothetical protein
MMGCEHNAIALSTAFSNMAQPAQQLLNAIAEVLDAMEGREGRTEEERKFLRKVKKGLESSRPGLESLVHIGNLGELWRQLLVPTESETKH